MIWIQLLVFLAAIAIGARLGGIAIGLAGGIGVVVLALLGVTPGDMPLDVIVIMMAVITTTAVVQAAGGMDYLVSLTGRLLRRYPQRLSFLAPAVTWLLVVTSGTGTAAFASFPVIAEVAKENDIRPSRPLSLSALASMTAIVASPVSAAVVYFSSLLDQTGAGLDYLDILAVTVPATLVGVLMAAGVMLVIDKWRGVTKLSGFDGWTEEKVAQIKAQTMPPEQITRQAKLSVWIFLISLVLIIAYAMSISDKIGLIKNPVMGRDQAIIAIMLTAGAVIAAVCRVDITKVLDTSAFKSGGSSYVCCLGVAWLGTTFINWNQETILATSSGVLEKEPWMLAVILVIASTLLWSQAATSKALMPLALTLVPASVAVASFPAVAGFFILPTYMTVVGAVAIDDTGTTRIGKYVFNHSFIVPGAINMVFTIALGFLFSALFL